MRNFTAVAFLMVFSVATFAAERLSSPFRSSIGLDIPNSHALVDSKVYRGMSPLGKAGSLAKLGVTDVLIFKVATQQERDQEAAELKAVGLDPEITYIAFPWKDFSSEKSVCKLAVKALKKLRDVHQTPGKSIYFHCTVGEDRTGFLAGLFQLMTNPNAEVKSVFGREMCNRGYSGGDPNKPQTVVRAVDSELTPLFVKMANLIKSGTLKISRLNEKVCDNLPDVDSKAFRCKPSPLATR